MCAPSDRLASLASPAFIAALALLVLNDFVLKPVFHNALTGKLSDFAGLFALTVFAATLWPRQRWFTGSLIAAAFMFWKSPYAEPAIAWFNAISPFAMGRTVDFTDLMALPMIPLGIWAAARVRPWPLPRVLQVGLAILAPIAFTATSRASFMVRSTLDVPSAAVVDETAIQSFLDELAEQHGLRCVVCEPLGEGRVYMRQARPDGPGSLVVNFDGENRELFFTTIGYSRDGRRGVLALASDIRAGLDDRFPGITATTFEDTYERTIEQATTFVVEVPSGDGLAVERAEQAKRALSSIVEELVRAHGLRADASSLVYYAGRRVGISAEERDFVLVPRYGANATLGVHVASSTPRFDDLQIAVAEDLAQRVNAAFGPANVTRHHRPRQ